MSETSKAPKGRAKRIPVNSRSVLPKFDMEAGYQYRIVNDVDDRIERFEDGGWEILPASAIRRSERRVNAPSAPGSLAQVSVGQGTKALIMRQKNEDYEEDQAEKQAYVDRTEETMKADAQKGRYGKLETGFGT